MSVRVDMGRDEACTVKCMYGGGLEAVDSAKLVWEAQHAAKLTTGGDPHDGDRRCHSCNAYFWDLLWQHPLRGEAF